jgi:hypothetical protein
MTEHASEEATRTAKHLAALAKAKQALAEHVPRLVLSHQVRAELNKGGAIGRFNDWLAVQVTKRVGTMWAAYLFGLISFISFPQALAAFLRGDRVTGVSWLSQSFLQLILLPIIMVGQNVISASQDARAEADHETLTVLHAINVHQLRILEDQQKIIDLLGQKAG